MYRLILRADRGSHWLSGSISFDRALICRRRPRQNKTIAGTPQQYQGQFPLEGEGVRDPCSHTSRFSRRYTLEHSAAPAINDTAISIAFDRLNQRCLETRIIALGAVQGVIQG